MRGIWLFFLSLNCLFALELGELKEYLKQSVHGDFYQEKRIVGFPQSIKTQGKFIIENRELVWQTQIPIQNTIKINSNGIYVLSPQKIWEKKDQQYDKQFFLDLIDLDFAQLQKNFNIKLSGTLSSWHIDLVPTGIILPKIFKTIKISGGKFIQYILLEEGNGDVSEIRFKNVK